MEIKRFGNIEGKTMMLLHGNLMCWQQFEDLIPLLERKFCVYAVSRSRTKARVSSTLVSTSAARPERLVSRHGHHREP